MSLLWFFVLAASLFILNKAADKFTETSEKIGGLLKFPHFVTGVLIVALGTSIPELATSIFGVLQGESGILAGNVTGSNVANVFLGLGLVVIISRRVAKFNWDSVSNDMPFLIGSTILLVITIIDGVFTFYEAIIFLLAYIIYVAYSLRIRKMNPKQIREDLKREVHSMQLEEKRKEEAESGKKKHNYLTKKEKTKRDLKLIFWFVLSLVLIFLSAKYTIDSLIEIATMLGIGTSALAASLVAAGTSLPEITVSISSARKGHFDMVIGNIMGSSIFNILVVFGAVGVFSNILIPNQVISFVLPVMAAAILIQWLVTIDKRITPTEAMLMLLLYITFIGKLFEFF